MKKFLSAMLISALAIGGAAIAHADNPIVQTIYTGDGAPMVANDTMYIYTGHDEDTATSWFDMREWHCYSSKDMANWTDLGSPLGVDTFTWAKKDAWAAQCIERDGKYYFYAPVLTQVGDAEKRYIGVAVADDPAGPFKDAIGGPLTDSEGTIIENIDPTIFIDDDANRTPYLYVGGGYKLSYIELDNDMVTAKTKLTDINTSEGMVGPIGFVDDFYEAPWLFKRDGKYYMLFSSGLYWGQPTFSQESVHYATSDSPTGGWKYQGKVMDTLFNDVGGWCFTCHVGLAEYKNHSYMFYHCGKLPGGGGYHRSECVEEFKFTDDGKIPFIPYTTTGPEQLEKLNPYNRVEAETMAFSGTTNPDPKGISLRTEIREDRSVNVCSIDDNDYIKVKGVDFGNDGAAAFTAAVACADGKGGTIELHIDSANGAKIGELPVTYTGGEYAWLEKSTGISGATGVHDLYFVFKGDNEDMFKFDYWQFTQKANDKQLVGITASAQPYKIDTADKYDKKTAAITATAIYANGDTEPLTNAEFTSDNTSVATVAQNGIVTAVSYGIANITVKSGEISEKVAIFVKDLDSEVTAKAITASAAELSVPLTLTANYTVTATFADGHTEDVTQEATAVYSSEIITADKGVITAKNTKGEATVTLSYQGEVGDSVSTTIKVTTFSIDAYTQIEAESYNSKEANNELSTEEADSGIAVNFIKNGDWLMYGGIDFGEVEKEISFTARASSGTAGGDIEIYIDSPDGDPIGTAKVKGSGDWAVYSDVSCNVSKVTGVHAVYLKFTGTSDNLMNFNWWKFNDAPIDTTTINAYDRIEAEDSNGSSGGQLGTEGADGGTAVNFIQNGSWLQFNNVDFGESGLASFTARAATDTTGGNIEIYIDGMGGTPIGTAIVSNTGGWLTYKDFSCNVTETTGVHTVYLKFTGNAEFLFNLNWWQFSKEKVDDSNSPLTFKIFDCNPQYEGGAEYVYWNDAVGMLDKHEGGTDGAVTFTVKVPAAGEYKMQVIKSTWEGSEKYSHIYTFNGDTANSVTFEYPFDWGQNTPCDFGTVTLNKGNNTIKIAANTGAINVQSVILTPLSTIGGDEPEETYKFFLTDCNPKLEGGAGITDWLPAINGIGQEDENGERKGAVTFTINVPKEGYYNMTAGIATWTSNNTPYPSYSHYYTINDNEPIIVNYMFDWKYNGLHESACSEPILLKEGKNTIKITAHADNSATDVGYLLLTYDRPSEPPTPPEPPVGDKKFEATITKAQADGNDIKATVKVSNTTDESVSAQVITALYDNNGVMLSAKLSDVKSFASGSDTDVSSTFVKLGDMQGCNVKAFVWDSAAGMKPIIQTPLQKAVE